MEVPRDKSIGPGGFHGRPDRGVFEGKAVPAEHDQPGGVEAYPAGQSALGQGKDRAKALPGKVFTGAVAAKPAPQHTTKDGAWQHGRRSGQLEPAGVVDAGGGRRPLIERGIVVVEQFAGEGGAGDGVATGRLDEGGQDVTADAVTEVDVGGVRGVLAPSRARSGQRGSNVRVRKREQRTEVDAVDGHDLHGSRRGESGGAGAAGQAHEHGLGNVVLMVTEAERSDAPATQLAIKERVTGGAGGGLGGGLAGGSVGPLTGDEGDAEGGADAGAKPRVGGGRGPAQAMVKVQGDQPARGGGRQVRAEQQEQRERVGPAGKGDRDATGVGSRQTSQGRRMQARGGQVRGKRIGDGGPIGLFFNHGLLGLTRIEINGSRVSSVDHGV